MGKHDADEGLGFFLGGAETVKNGSLWFVKHFKTILLVALIPAVGFSAYGITRFVVNKKKPKSEPVYAVASNIKNDEDKEKEFVGGYEVLGEIKAENVGVDVKVLDPELDGATYVEDSLKNGAVYYYGEKLDETKGNTVILGHNSADSFMGLKELEVNDSITVIDQEDKTTKYTVVEKSNCEPDDFSKFLPLEEDSREITLITCESEGTQRLVIKAVAK